MLAGPRGQHEGIGLQRDGLALRVHRIDVRDAAPRGSQGRHRVARKEAHPGGPAQDDEFGDKGGGVPSR